MQAILAITTKSMLLFKPYVRTCQECPIEVICGKLEMMEEPIPLTNVETLIDTAIVQFFCVAVKQPVREYLIFKSIKVRYKFFNIPSRGMKDVIVKRLRQILPALPHHDDEIFSTFLHGYCGAIEHEIVSLSFSPSPVKRPYSGEPFYLNPFLVCITMSKLLFYRMTLSKWRWIPPLPKIDYTDAAIIVQSDRQKKQEEEKEVI